MSDPLELNDHYYSLSGTRDQARDDESHPKPQPFTYFYDSDGELNYAWATMDHGLPRITWLGEGSKITYTHGLLDERASSYLFEKEGRLFTKEAVEITAIIIHSVGILHRQGVEEEHFRLFEAAFLRRKLNLLIDHD